MKQLLLQLLMISACIGTAHGNSMLKNPITGPLGNSKIEDICIAANGTDVVLLAADNASVYAIDIADNNASDETANTITTVPSFVSGQLNPVAGNSVTVTDMVINPISKSVYILATSGTNSYIFKVKNHGTSVTLLDLTNIKHSKMNWGSTLSVNDMAWGNNTLYVTSGSFSLNGAIGWTAAPFEHSKAITTRATSMFKSNWGGTYLTDAPLETIAYGFVNNQHRLMGVTTCAPGFSIDAAKLTGSGLLQVTEDFNINTGVSEKVVFQRHDNKNWLFDLHDNRLYRIGEKYLDGSQVTALKYNNNAELLRDMNQQPAAGLTDAEIKAYSGDYKMMAFWDDYRLLLLETGGSGALKLFQTAVSAPALSINSTVTATGSKFEIYPNPTENSIRMHLPNGMNNGTAYIYNNEGKLVLSAPLNTAQPSIDISTLPNGNYLINAISTSGTSLTDKFSIEK